MLWGSSAVTMQRDHTQRFQRAAQMRSQLIARINYEYVSKDKSMILVLSHRVTCSLWLSHHRSQTLWSKDKLSPLHEVQIPDLQESVHKIKMVVFIPPSFRMVCYAATARTGYKGNINHHRVLGFYHPKDMTLVTLQNSWVTTRDQLPVHDSNEWWTEGCLGNSEKTWAQSQAEHSMGLKFVCFLGRYLIDSIMLLLQSI